MSNLLYTDVEDELRASVRDLLTDRCPPEHLLAIVETAQPVDLDLWHRLEPGLAVPEELGGQGASARELSVVAEEVGRALAPVPFLGSAVLATAALAGTEQVRPLADGSRTGALLVPVTTAPDAAFPTTVTATGNAATGNALSGTVRAVADASVADLFVVPAAGPEGPGLYLADAQGATVTPLPALDMTRGLADVTLDGVAATRVETVTAPGALADALRHGAAMVAAESLGAAQWCLDTTVTYVRERYQFARPVGSFQALKHRLADLWVEVVTARAAARHAADCLATGDADAAVAVAVAKAHCTDIAVHAAEEAVQLHGGLGMTWEHPVHLYLKRTKANQLVLGSPEAHHDALGDLVDLAR